MSDPLGLHPIVLPDGLGIPAEDWHQTPTSVQQQGLSLLKWVEALEARVNRDSFNSSRPLVSEGVQRFHCWSKPFPVCLKATGLI